jgi:flagellar P-ring protein precursor FlgI
MRALASLLLLALAARPATRLKELATIEGVRDNQLVGYGLVVGLNGTGDKRQTYFAAQTLSNLLDRMGVQVSPTAMQVRNTAGVMITATLPPFAQPGGRIDVQVAAIGDATNLQGGLLILTPLKSATGEVYAVAQGPVVTGGFSAGSRGTGNTMTVNHPTAGRIPNGAIIERGAPSTLSGERIRLQLRRADFTNSARIAAAINSKFKSDLARAENAAAVLVDLPPDWRARPVEFLAAVEEVSIDSDQLARIVINERTGTIALGRDVVIKPASILHGSLSVDIQTSFEVSQPAPFSKGETTVVPQVGVAVKEESARNIQLRPGATVDDLVKALTAIGATARDIIAILQSLKSAGALEAELEVI